VADDLARAPAPTERQPAYRFRFGIAYLVLAAVLGTAIGTGILLASRGDEVAGPAWSSWQPAAKDNGGRIREIVRYVARRYRLDAERQLVAVIPGLPSIQNGDQRIAIRGVAVRAPVTPAQQDFSFVETDNGLMYILCGGAQSCAMAGQASNARGQLVRREALELALYTFKYIDGVDSILAFWPPRAGSQATHALFFRKSDFDEQLGQPLRDTLAPVTALQPTTLNSLEATLVDRLTLPHFFRAQPVQAQDGSAILVLDPVVLGS
jgi:hypothetical protein